MSLLPRVTKVVFTLVVDGEERTFAYARPDKIKQLLEEDKQSLGVWLRSLRDAGNP